MKSEIKAKWLEALRSGKYVQGRHTLRNSDDTYCCLGVLCDLVDSTMWFKRDYRTWMYGSHSGRPSGSVYEQTELTFHYAGKLVKMNDSEGATFLQIADYIEKEL